VETVAMIKLIHLRLDLTGYAKPHERFFGRGSIWRCDRPLKIAILPAQVGAEIFPYAA